MSDGVATITSSTRTLVGKVARPAQRFVEHLAEIDAVVAVSEDGGQTSAEHGHPLDTL